MEPKALIFWGGWDGHKPEQIAHMLAAELEKNAFCPTVAPSLDPLNDLAALKAYTLIVPCWTMGVLSETQTKNLQEAVKAGVGLAGIHGGMGDAFRGNLDYEWMCGGHFVAHPHVGAYTVRVRDFASPIVAGLPGTFPYRSEQYYVLTDPAIHVLADTEYLHEGRAVTMPVAWLKTWGEGRVFYSSLGHTPEEFTEFPEALTLTVRGLLWAARAL